MGRCTVRNISCVILASLFYPRSSSTDVQAVIVSIRRQGSAYYRAVDRSIQAAVDGYKFSSDAIDLCDALLDPQTTREDLLEFIGEMKVFAKKALDDANSMCEDFRMVRHGLNEVTTPLYVHIYWPEAE